MTLKTVRFGRSGVAAQRSTQHRAKRGATLPALAATLAAFTSLILGTGGAWASPQAQAQVPQGTQSVTLTKSPYGTTQDGRAVDQFVLRNARGSSLTLTNYGALVLRLEVLDRSGKLGNIVLGFPDLASYEQHNGTIHFGAIIGRFANRIAQGRFMLDGRRYHLPINDPPNTLHSGPNGFDSQIWSAQEILVAGLPAVAFTYVSPAGQNGFPGTLTARVVYTLDAEDQVRIRLSATTDAPTVVNMTSHTYFNLAGEGAGSIGDHHIQIAAARYTPTDKTQIPTGILAPVAGTPFDLRQPVPINSRWHSADPQMLIAHGYDQNWVLDRPGIDPRTPAARVSDPSTGRTLTLWTTQPGLQFYTANGLDGSVVGTSGTTYRQGDGFALEAQHFPDSPNQPAFPSTVLRPGQTYVQEVVWRFSAQ